MATFIHNEPTSLVIIQEAGLPDVFYRAIEIGLEPAIEVEPCGDGISTVTEIHSPPGHTSHSECNRRTLSESSRPGTTHKAPEYYPWTLSHFHIGTSSKSSYGQGQCHSHWYRCG